MTTQSELIRAQNLERANLIDQLSTARRILAFNKGILEASKVLAQVAPTVYSFNDVEQEALNRINAFLAEGLFGDKPGNGACRFSLDQIKAAGRTCKGTAVDPAKINGARA